MTTVGLRVFPEPAEDEGRFIHTPFQPADIRQGDPVQAVLRFDGAEGRREERSLQVWRLSPLGVELLEGSEPLALPTGALVDLELHIGRQVTELKGMVVKDRHQVAGHSLIGIRWYQEASASTNGENRRAAQRWSCGSEFMPTGVAANPIRFNDFIHFRVRELSREGAQVLTSLRNRFVVPGMRLDAIVSFPAIGQVRLEMQIVHARVVADGGKDYLMLGMKLIQPTADALQIIGQYILQFGPPTTLQELRDSKLLVQSSAKAIDFSYVRTAEEYRQVLELRRMAYVGANKLSDELRPEDMSDIFDSRARILIGRYRGEVVATLRLMFHEPTDQFEHEQYISFPDDFPRRDEMVEITRVCTHPSYRGSDLLLALFKHAVLTAAQSRRRWIVGSATPKLLKVYTKVGCQLTSVHYRHEALGGDEHTIFLGDVYGAISGSGLGPVLWNAMYADIWNFLNVGAMFEVDSVVRTRLAFYRLLSPLTQLIARRLLRPRAAKTP